MSKHGKSNGVPEGPRIATHVLQLLERGAVAREVEVEVDRRLKRLVDQLKKKYPDQTNVILQQLMGQYSDLLQERDQNKRLAREAERPERDASDPNEA